MPTGSLCGANSPNAPVHLHRPDVAAVPAAARYDAVGPRPQRSWTTLTTTITSTTSQNQDRGRGEVSNGHHGSDDAIQGGRRRLLHAPIGDARVLGMDRLHVNSRGSGSHASFDFTSNVSNSPLSYASPGPTTPISPTCTTTPVDRYLSSSRRSSTYQAPTAGGMASAPQDSSATPRFRLSILQQPQAARACGNGEKDRRTIDPPPILSLNPIGDDVPSASVKTFLDRCPGVVLCSILDAVTGADAARVGNDRRRLLGTLASPIHHLENTTLLTPWVACFPDLSVRTPGRYRLKFSIVFMAAHGPGTRLPVMASATSEEFECFSAKDFPGMQASSALVRELRKYGIDAPSKRGRSGNQGDSPEDTAA